MNKLKSILIILMYVSAAPFGLIGLSGVIYELFGLRAYERFLAIFHIKLTLGQIQLIGLISFMITLLLFLVWRILDKK